MADATLLVAGLYAHDDLLAHAAHTFEGYELFNSYSEPGYKLLWECIRDIFIHTGAKPTAFVLGAQLKGLSDSVDFLMRDKAAAQLAETVSIIWNVDNAIGREHTVKLLEAASQRAAIDKLLSVNDLDDTEASTLMEYVDDVSNMLGSITPKKGVRKRPLAREERTRLLRVTPRWKWGIDYWDLAELSWYKKEIHGLLGPTGGGKTVNMTNIATGQIKAGRKVAVALYEQALEEDVEQRILSNLAGVSMNELRDKDESQIDKKAKAKIDTMCDQYESQLIVLDMIGEDAGSGGVQELKAQLAEEERESGFVPDLLIIDWLGEMVMRYALLGDSDAAYRRCCEKFMSELVQFKEDTGISVLVLHQTNTHAQALGPTSKPNKTMAHEFRSFANKCDTCSVLGTMDRSLQVCWFVPDKSRRSNSRDRLVQLSGEYMRFTDVTAKYEEMGNVFVEISAAVEVREEAAEAARTNVEQGYMQGA